jgi:hypothetical protein
MNYHRAGLAQLGSILLPESQERRLDAMRRDSLERVDAAAGKVSTAVVVSAVVTGLSTAALLHSAWKLRRAR